MKILRLSEVLDKVPLSRSLIYTMIEKGEFPRPFKLGARANAWSEEEVNDWIRSRFENREAYRSEIYATRERAMQALFPEE